MTVAAKKLGLITRSPKVYGTFVSQLSAYFRDSVEIEGFCLDEPVRRALEASVVLVSREDVLAEVASFMDRRAQVVVCRRSLSLDRLSELLRLPAAARALVVSNSAASAWEVVERLRELGLDHLVLEPYWPGCQRGLEDFDVVITPGMPHLIPPDRREKVIDLGIRGIDVSTLIELSVRLGLPLEKPQAFTTRYVGEIVRLTREYIVLAEEARDLKERLNLVLDTVSEAILEIDPAGKVRFANAAATRIFRASLEGDQAHLRQMLPELGSDVDAGSDRLRDVGDRTFLVSKTAIKSGDQVTGHLIVCRDVTDVKRLEAEVRRQMRERGHVAKYTFADLVGQSVAFRQALEVARRLARTDLTVLIMGENGTGKELFAQAIHNASPRAGGPFLAINLAALPESLLESELFGYEEGAFTGARKGGKPGLFEQAHGGTLLLDEIGDLPPGTQVKLLRVLQEREVMRVGGTRVMPVDVRIIAATNRDLRTLVEQSRFREDLYYRLRVCPLRIPPLRERKEDIPLLVRHFLDRFGCRHRELPSTVIKKLMEHRWPGNVRELEGVIQYLASVWTEDGDDLQALLQDVLPPEASGPQAVPPPQPPSEDFLPVAMQLRGYPEEYLAILRALARCRDEGCGGGRHRLATMLEDMGVPLSPQELRTRLRLLAAHGYVVVGRGRQGTRITERGVALLGKLSTSDLCRIGS